jgi:hypothetical protein
MDAVALALAASLGDDARPGAENQQAWWASVSSWSVGSSLSSLSVAKVCTSLTDDGNQLQRA